MNSIGDSAPSEARSIIAATVPDAPSQPTLVAQDETSIQIAWTANFNGGTPIDDYEVYWKLSSASDYLDSVLSTGNALGHTVAVGLDTGLEYDFKVRAKNDVGVSEYSPVSRFMAARAADAPPAPTSSFADQTSITVDWTAPYTGGTPITNYKVLWNLGGTGTTFTDLVTVDSTTFTYTQAALTTGEIYKFRVVAVNFVGDGAESDILQVYAATKPLQPSTPVQLSAD